MADYYLFLLEHPNGYCGGPDGDTPGTIFDHLNYLQQYGGTPQCWASVEGTLEEARNARRPAGRALLITDAEFKPVDISF